MNFSDDKFQYSTKNLMSAIFVIFFFISFFISFETIQCLMPIRQTEIALHEVLNDFCLVVNGVDGKSQCVNKKSNRNHLCPTYLNMKFFSLNDTKWSSFGIENNAQIDFYLFSTKASLGWNFSIIWKQNKAITNVSSSPGKFEKKMEILNFWNLFQTNKQTHFFWHLYKRKKY